MATIFVEGLGNVEIQGEVPTKEEQQAILEALETPSTNIENQLLDNIPDSTDTPSLGSEDIGATDTVIPEMIDPGLAEIGKPQGLEKIGGRGTFEAAGAIAGSVVGGATLTPASSVAGGTLGAVGMGQLYDVLQSAITDEPTDFGTQIGRVKSDLQREATLQTIFAKVPAMGAKIKGLIFGKADKSLYESAKRMGFPLSLSDSGNMIARGYGRVVGVFPFIGTPIKRRAGLKGDFLNNKAKDTLNTFGPNVTLTKLGIDMEKAATSTFDDFRRVSSFFYDDFYKSVNKIRNTPVISTKNYKAALEKYTNGIDSGRITGIKSPQKDAIYKYAKQTIKKMPDYINATQYKSLKEDIKYYARLSKKEPFNIKVLTGLKSSLERDLRLLTKSDYQENLLKNVYPMSKSKKELLNPKLLSDIATKLKFADKVYANGLQNSIIKDMAKKEGAKKVKDLVPIPGKKVFDSPVSREFKKVDKNIFGPGFEVQGSINVDLLGDALLKRGASKALFADLRSLVGQKQFDKFTRARLQKAYDGSLITSSEKGSQGLIFDPYAFESNLGLNTERGREILEEMLKGSKVSLLNLDDFFAIAKNHAGLKVPDVSSFVARRATLGGTRSVLGGALFLGGATTSPLASAGLIILARKTSRSLSNPGALRDIMTVIDPNSPKGLRKGTTLKLLDGLISDSQNRIEKNELSLYREYIETLPLDEIQDGIDETLDSSQRFLNMNSDVEEPLEDNKKVPINNNRSQLPTPPLETPNINPASFDKTIMAQGTVDQTGLTSSELAFLDDEEKAMRLNQRGMA